jgi:hypothetical protein
MCTSGVSNRVVSAFALSTICSRVMRRLALNAVGTSLRMRSGFVLHARRVGDSVMRSLGLNVA